MPSCETYKEEGTPNQLALSQKCLLPGYLNSPGKSHTARENVPV